MTVKQVLVTGATGRTGSLVLQKCRQLAGYRGRGLARSRSKVEALFPSVADFYFGDVTDLSTLHPAMLGCRALVIVTSSVPKRKSTSGDQPEFEFEPGGSPEAVDYYGHCHQIDAAQAAGIEHVVLVGSMGGTQANHPLNRLGQVLIWKRRAEQYLIESGLIYTIIRAGGLQDQPGGRRELVVGKNDTLLNAGMSPTIPRADVAELAVQALQHPEACNKAFDVIAKPEADPPGVITQDFMALFQQTRPGL